MLKTSKARSLPVAVLKTQHWLRSSYSTARGSKRLGVIVVLISADVDSGSSAAAIENARVAVQIKRESLDGGVVARIYAG